MRSVPSLFVLAFPLAPFGTPSRLCRRDYFPIPLAFGIKAPTVLVVLRWWFVSVCVVGAAICGGPSAEWEGRLSHSRIDTFGELMAQGRVPTVVVDNPTRQHTTT